MTKLRFMQRAYLKVSKKLDSITDGSHEAYLTDIVYEPALKQFIQDSQGKEFSSSFEPPLVHRYKSNQDDDPANPFHKGGFSIYGSHPNFIIPTDKEDIVDEYGQFYSNYGRRYIPVYYPGGAIPEGNYFITTYGGDDFVVQGLWFKQNLALWSPKAIEGAVCYAGYLLAPEVNADDATTLRLQRQYQLQLDQYKVFSNTSQRYRNRGGDGTILGPSGQSGVFAPGDDEIFNLPILPI